MHDGVADPITLEQAAQLLHKCRKTLYNRSLKNPPPVPDIAASGRRAAVWSYRRLRPWLIEQWADCEMTLPMRYSDAKRLF